MSIHTLILFAKKSERERKVIHSDVHQYSFSKEIHPTPFITTTIMLHVCMHFAENSSQLEEGAHFFFLLYVYTYIKCKFYTRKYYIYTHWEKIIMYADDRIHTYYIRIKKESLR